MEEVLDAEYLRDTIGKALYDRVMQWNDSGAAEALLASKQRQKARNERKPCWVPKLKNDLYVNTVDWEEQDVVEETIDISRSPIGRTDEEEELTFEKSEQNYIGICPPEGESEKLLGTVWNEETLAITSSVPFMVDAVLEDCVDGRRLVVAGQPIEPSGWGDLEPLPASGCDGGAFIFANPPPSQADPVLSSLAGMALRMDAAIEPTGWGGSHGELTKVLNSPCLVESVLHDFGDGPRLLVGGWPVQPSWEQLDHNWAQLRCDVNTVNTCLKEFCHKDGSEYIPTGESGFEGHPWRVGEFSNVFTGEAHYLTRWMPSDHSRTAL